MHYLLHRSSLKRKANQRHEEEKDYTVTLQAVGVGTGSYDGDSALPSQAQPEGIEDIHSYDQDDDNASCYSFDNGTVSSDEPRSSKSDDSGNYPVIFLYDCEATGGNFHNDHIIEVASLVIEPDGVSVTEIFHCTMPRSSRHICKIGKLSKAGFF